jgi:hypothetical protein
MEIVLYYLHCLTKGVFMNRSLIVVAVALALTACSSTKNSGLIADQKLATSFVNEQIKIETKCAMFGSDNDCKIVAIEATGTAPSFGATVNNRKNALTRAEMKAKANVAEFMDSQISTEKVQTTIAKNIEKASDRVKSGNADGSTVEMTDQEAKNVSLRENNNNTVVTLTETVRTSSRAMLRGFRKIKEEVVGDQEVAVTIRWDIQSNNAGKQLKQLMQ